jgi:hypothetical protein
MMHYFYQLTYPTSLPAFDATEPVSLHGTASTPTGLPPEPEQEPLREAVDSDYDDFWSTIKTKKKKGSGFVKPEEPEEPPFGLTVHAKVFGLAEKYWVAGLKELAVLKFRAEAKTHWNAKDFLLAAEMAYIEVVEDVQELRTAVIDVFQSHSNLLKQEDCQSLFERVPKLTYDMLLRSHGIR